MPKSEDYKVVQWESTVQILYSQKADTTKFCSPKKRPLQDFVVPICGDYKLLWSQNADTTKICDKKADITNFIMKKEETMNFVVPKSEHYKFL